MLTPPGPESAPAGWAPALAFVLRREGGYVDNPHDPGGATNHGVTQAVYDAWRTDHGQTHQPVTAISDEDVATLYWHDYWRPSCGTLNLADPGCQLAVFDTAVNMGVARARRLWLLRSGDERQRLAGYVSARRRVYDAIIAAHPVLEEFRAGWYTRLRALQRAVGLPRDPALSPVIHLQKAT